MFDTQTVPVLDITTGHIIRFHDKVNNRLKQGIVIDTEDLSDPDDGMVIFHIQNQTVQGYYLQIFDPTDTVDVVGYVNNSYLDFIFDPQAYQPQE